MKNIMLVILGVVLFAACVYGMYFVVKTVSYTIFYEDMVIDTVNQVLIDKGLLE